MANDDLGDLTGLAAELAEALAPTIQLGGLLGRGGMGAVFLARDPALKRSVVVKVLSPDLAHDETLRKRFAREAESAAAVAHPHVVAVHAVGELPKSKTSYFVMQYVDGVTLGDACPEGVKVPAARVARIVGEVASALAAAHARGLVHRDIKPANVMLEKTTERAIVLDFGISGALSPSTQHPAPNTRLTQQGTSLGTPHYMSPEQASGEDVTGQSDVYSLGVVAFELLAGRAPFEATSPMALVAAHIKDAPPDLTTLRPDIDPAFAGLVDRMLAKAPADRPTADEVSRALLPASHALIEWPPPGLERLRGEMARALRWLVGGMAAMLAFYLVLMLQPGLDTTTFFSLSAIMGIGAISVFVAAALATGIAGGRIAWARRSGYPWLTAIDASLDTHADTAELLNASGRYAALDAGGGAALMARRRQGAVALGIGVLLSAVLIFLWSNGLIGWAGGTMEPIRFYEIVLLLLPTVAGVAAWALLTSRERKLRRRVMAREPVRWGFKRQQPPVPAELVAGWLKGARVTPPPQRTRWQIALARSAYETPAAAVALLLEGAVLATVLAAFFLPRGGGNVQDRHRWEAAVAKNVARTGGFSGLDAAMGRAARARDEAPADTAAASAMVRGNAAAEPVRLDAVWAAFSALPGRLPDSLRAVLSAMANAEGAGLYARVAASGPLPPAWYGSAAMLTSVSDQRGIGRATGNISRASARRAAAAALALANGDRGAAEREGRRILAVGRHLWRDAMSGAASSGLGILDIGVQVLRSTALASGNGALGREADSLASLVALRREQAELFRPYRFEAFYAVPGDTGLLAFAGRKDLAASDRWQVLAAIGGGVCWNPVELRRGVAPERREVLAEAARRAADIPHTEAWAARLGRELDTADDASVISNGGGPGWALAWMKPAMRAMACGGGRVG